MLPFESSYTLYTSLSPIASWYDFTIFKSLSNSTNPLSVPTHIWPFMSSSSEYMYWLGSSPSLYKILVNLSLFLSYTLRPSIVDAISLLSFVQRICHKLLLDKFPLSSFE